MLGLFFFLSERPEQLSTEPRIFQSKGKLMKLSPDLPRAFLASELCEQPIETKMKIDVRQEHEKEKWIMSQSKS